MDEALKQYIEWGGLAGGAAFTLYILDKAFFWFQKLQKKEDPLTKLLQELVKGQNEILQKQMEFHYQLEAVAKTADKIESKLAS